MIDGKVYNTVTETKSSQTCPVCGATPKQMNNLELISKRQKCTDHINTVSQLFMRGYGFWSVSCIFRIICRFKNGQQEMQLIKYCEQKERRKFNWNFEQELGY